MSSNQINHVDDRSLDMEELGLLRARVAFLESKLKGTENVADVQHPDQQRESHSDGDQSHQSSERNAAEEAKTTVRDGSFPANQTLFKTKELSSELGHSHHSKNYYSEDEASKKLGGSSSSGGGDWSYDSSSNSRIHELRMAKRKKEQKVSAWLHMERMASSSSSPQRPTFVADISCSSSISSVGHMRLSPLALNHYAQQQTAVDDLYDDATPITSSPVPLEENEPKKAVAYDLFSGELRAQDENDFLEDKSGGNEQQAQTQQINIPRPIERPPLVKCDSSASLDLHGSLSFLKPSIVIPRKKMSHRNTIEFDTSYANHPDFSFLANDDESVEVNNETSSIPDASQRRFTLEPGAAIAAVAATKHSSDNVEVNEDITFALGKQNRYHMDIQSIKELMSLRNQAKQQMSTPEMTNQRKSVRSKEKQANISGATIENDNASDGANDERQIERMLPRVNPVDHMHIGCCSQSLPQLTRRRAWLSMRDMLRLSLLKHQNSAAQIAIDAYLKSQLLNLEIVAKGENVESLSFGQFCIFSANQKTIQSCRREDMGRLEHAGGRFLDPFRVELSDMMDHFPVPSSGNGGNFEKEEKKSDVESMEPEALSSFCLPGGVSLRLIPRCAMDGAERLGWVGKKADKHQLLAFTDGAGITIHGAAVTVYEELSAAETSDLQDVVDNLRKHRRQRAASTCLSRWWRQCLLKKSPTAISHSSEHPIHFGHDSGATAVRSNRTSLERIKHKKTHFLNLFGHFSADLQHAHLPGKIEDFSNSERAPSKKKKGFKKNKVKKEKTTASNGDANEAINSTQHPKSGEAAKKKKNKESKKKTKRQFLSDKMKKNASKTKNISLSINRALKTETQNKKALEGPNSTENPKAIDNSMDFKKQSKIKTINKVVAAEKKKMKNEVQASKVKHALRKEKVVGKNQVNEKRWRSESFLCADSSRSLNLEYVTSSGTRHRAKEAYQKMVDNERCGDVVVVEKCYVLVGGRPKEQILLLSALQKIVDWEREERVLGTKNPIHGNSKHTILENTVMHTSFEDGLAAKRHELLMILQHLLRLSAEQKRIKYPKNLNGYINGSQQRFELKMPIRNAPKISLPLPLPEVDTHWGFAKLLFLIGSDSLMHLLRLLLMERSVLVLGENSAEVTACTCALLKLLKPYEWAGTFMPSLPLSMLDFINSPVPFVAGIVSKYPQNIEEDYRTKEAIQEGVSVVNLSRGELIVTTENDIETMLSLCIDPTFDLHLHEQQLNTLAKDESSALCSFSTFLRQGFTPLESVTIHTACVLIERHLQAMSGIIGRCRDGWQHYGKINEKTNDFDFYPSLFVEPLRAQVQFQEMMAQTQLFVGYVDKRREEDLSEDYKRKVKGVFIAHWIYNRWIKAQKKSFVPF